MTSARLLASPAEGHGITSKIADELYQALVDGQPTGTLCVVAVLEPVAASQRKTAKGLHRSVTFEVSRVEIVDGDRESEIRWLADDLYKRRTSRGSQRVLPLGFPGLAEEERRMTLIEAIESWADGQGMSGGDLEASWRDHFGIGPDEERSFGDQGVHGDYRKAPAVYLLEFADAKEAVERGPLPSEEREAADAEQDAAEPVAAEPVAEQPVEVPEPAETAEDDAEPVPVPQFSG